MKEVNRNIVTIGNAEIGGPEPVIIAGPCSIESEEQFLNTANAVKSAGATVLRGGMFKLRTSPKSFQGMGVEAADLVKKVKAETGMPFISEIIDPRHFDFLDDVVDAYQVGSRNMYNYALLKEFGQTKKPVMLKRGFSATIDEWLLAAEYIAEQNNHNIILCERGIRSFEPKTRNTLDLNAVAYLRQNCPWPLIVDPSHGTGLSELVTPMALAGIAAGGDGLMVEVHPEPEKALSDGRQALTPDQFQSLVERVIKVATAIG